MRWFRQSTVGILGDFLLILPLLPRFLEWVLELRIVRVGLGMANLGQAVDFAIQHLENPGWLGNGWVQFAVIAIGLTLIFWDRKRPSWLPSPELSSRQMIVGGLIIIVFGAVVVGVGIWRQPRSAGFEIGRSPIGSDAPIGGGASSPQIATQQPAGRPTIPRVAYTERDIREMLDALDEGQDMVEKQLMPLWEPTQNRLINGLYLLTSLGVNETITGLNESKDTLQTKVWPPVNNFVYKEHSGYQSEMRIALALDSDVAKGDLTRAIQAIIDRLKLFPESPDKIEPKSFGLVQDEYEKAEKLNNQFWGWLLIAQSRIKEIKNNLRTKGVTGYEAPQ